MRKFCIDIVKATVEERERHGVVRKDLMQSLIQLRNNNSIEFSDEFKIDTGGMKYANASDDFYSDLFE